MPDPATPPEFESLPRSDFPDDEAAAAKTYWASIPSDGYAKPQPWSDVVASRVLDHAPQTVFEFGCNAGKNLLAIKNRNPAVSLNGIDVNPGAISTARQAGLGCEVGDDLHLATIPDNAYDVVFTVSVLDHLPHPEDAFKHLLRIARKAAIFYEPWLGVEGKITRRKHRTNNDLRAATPYSYSWSYERMAAELGQGWLLDMDHVPLQNSAPLTLGKYYHFFVLQPDMKASERALETTHQQPELRLVAGDAFHGEPSISLSETPVWIELKVKAGKDYRVLFEADFAKPYPVNGAIATLKYETDTQSQKNELGHWSKVAGRFQYLKEPKAGDPVEIKLTIPKHFSGPLHLGLRKWKGKGRMRISRGVSLTLSEPTLDVFMSPPEENMLIDYISRSSGYLEFGSGGSTLAAVRGCKGPLACVEADPDWARQLLTNAEIDTAHAAGRLTLSVPPIGAVGAWSKPVGGPHISWISYWADIWSKIEFSPDLVLIDGRFRAACILASLLACKGTTIILVHDFGTQDTRRDGYNIILPFVDIVQQIDTLVAVRRTADFRADLALSALSKASVDIW